MYRKKTITMIFLGIVILTVTTALSYALIMGNFAEIAFVPPVDPEDPETKSIPLSDSIINGAGSYLKAYSNLMLFLNRVEMADIDGVDYKEMGTILNNAVGDMEMAKEAYTGLKQSMDNTPYNPAVIDYLLAFDYKGLQEAYGLNASIFEQVGSYLGKGDVRGFFGHLLTSTGAILEQLYKMKESVDTENLPAIEDLWRINQDFSETMLFGQYAAKVFKNFIIKRGKEWEKFQKNY
jgi:hypothetical protein